MDHFFKLGIYTLALTLSSCSEKPQDRYEFIEYVEVTGICQENHVGKYGEYTGSLVHWYNETTGIHSRYGFVRRQDFPNEINQIREKQEYIPPFIVNFDEIQPRGFSQKNMLLHGNSVHLASNTGSASQIEATCQMKEIRRLDYYPENEHSQQANQ